MLREAINTVFVEGILSEVDVTEKSFARDGKNTDAISGTFKVLVEREVNGELDVNEVPFTVFATKYTKAGNINPAYESIEALKTYTSIAACGSKEDADRVRISKGRIQMNAFYSVSGQLINQPRVSTSFISKVTKDFTPKADFELEFFVSRIEPAIDKDGVEVTPRKLNVTAIVPMYGGKVQEVPLVTTNPNVVNAIERYWEVGKTYRANGRLNFKSEIKEVIQEVDFGEPVKKNVTVSLHEFAITGGSQASIDEDFAFSVDDVRSAMAERKAILEEQKNKPKKTSPAPANQTTISRGLDLGF